MPIIGHMFFSHNPFLADWAEIFMGAQETYMISRLVMRNLSYDAYFSFLISEQLLARNYLGFIWANRYDLEVMFSGFNPPP